MAFLFAKSVIRKYIGKKNNQQVIYDFTYTHESGAKKMKTKILIGDCIEQMKGLACR